MLATSTSRVAIGDAGSGPGPATAPPRAALVCEVRDAGRFEDPLVGRERPPLDRDGGWGLWLVNQLCDLVQLRSFPTGAVVRLHVWRDPPARRAS